MNLCWAGMVEAAMLDESMGHTVAMLAGAEAC